MQEDHLYNKQKLFAQLCHRIWPEEFPQERVSHRYFSLTFANRVILTKFKHYLENSNYGINRKHRLIESLALIAELYGKDLETANKEDIQGEGGLQSKIVQRWSKNDTTVQMHLQMLKQFYKWLYKIPVGSNRQVDILDGIHFMQKKGKRIFELPSEDQVAKLISQADGAMYKALFSTLYNSAGRIGEIASLRVKDAVFDGDQAIIHITNSKTDQRPVLLLDSAVSMLREWLAIHPHRDKPNFQDEYLFVSVATKTYGKPITHAAVTKMLRLTARKAGINKVSPHKLRHWKATHLIMRGLNETKLKAILGHSFNSRATAVYLHVASKDTFDTIRQIYHKEKQTIQTNPQETKVCAFCGLTNSFSQEACSRCNRILGLNNEPVFRKNESAEEINSMRQKMEMLERSMSILIANANNPCAASVPEIAKQVVIEARKTTSMAVENHG